MTLGYSSLLTLHSSLSQGVVLSIAQSVAPLWDSSIAVVAKPPPQILSAVIDTRFAPVICTVGWSPLFSRYKPLIWSRRRSQNRNNSLGNGSNSKHAPTARCRGNLVFVPPTPAASYDVSALRLSFRHPIMAVTERCATFRYYCLMRVCARLFLRLWNTACPKASGVPWFLSPFNRVTKKLLW